MSECPLFGTEGEGDFTIDGSRLSRSCLGLTDPTGGCRVGHPPTLAIERQQGSIIQRSSVCGSSLRSRPNSLQFETSSCHVEDVSQEVPHTLAQRQNGTHLDAQRPLVERPDEVSLPRVARRRIRDRAVHG